MVELVPNGIKTDEVTFDQPFSSAPVILLSLTTNLPHQRMISVSDRSVSGFTVCIKDETEIGGNINYTWVAVCVKN